MIVVDASAVVELLLLTPRGIAVGDRILVPGATVCAPELLDLEVAQVLRRFVFQGELSEIRAGQGLRDLFDLRVRRYPHLALMARIWALRENLSAYDGAYVALAEALDAVLLTGDHRLAKAPHGARVEVV